MFKLTASGIIILVISFFLAVNSSCNQHPRNLLPPSNELGFVMPARTPFKFGQAQQLILTEHEQAIVNPPEERNYDFNVTPIRAIDIGTSSSLPSPPEEIRFNWNNLPDTIFNLAMLEDIPLNVKTYFVPKPIKIEIGQPKVKQGPSFGILSLGPNEGLPNSRIDDLIQDHNGIIWYACGGNLYRYNGQFAEQFELIGRPLIIKIYEDRAGRLWLGADQDNGFYVLDTKAGIEWHIEMPHAIFDIVQHSNGQYWLGTRAGGLYVINWEKRTAKNFRKYPEDGRKNRVEDVLEDNRHRIWFAGDDGIGIIDLAQQKVNYLTKAEGLHFDITWSLAEDKQGRIWVGPDYEHAGINVIYPDSGFIQYFGHAQGINKPGLSSIQDKDQNIYVAADSLLIIFDKDLKSFRKISLNEKYSDYWIGHILFDRDGQLWMGTRTSGIMIFPVNGPQPYHLRMDQGLRGEAVYALMEDHIGQHWLGGINTAGGSAGWINVIDSSGKKIYDLSGAIPNFYYPATSFWEDKQGNVWTGILGGGIEVFDMKNGSITHIGERQGLYPMVYSLIADSRGLMWIGKSKGVALYDPRSKRIKDLKGSMTLDNSLIYCLFEDSKKRIWIGTDKAGVFMIDSNMTTIEQYSMAEGLSNNLISGILEDVKGRIWIATENGIDVIDISSDEHFHITTKEGLANDGVYGLKRVNENIYAGTANGISIFTNREPTGIGHTSEKERLSITTFQKGHGLLYSDVNTNGIMVTKKGQLWVGANWQALTIMNLPTMDDTASLEPTITGIELFDKPQVFSKKFLVENTLNDRDTIFAANKTTYWTKRQLPSDSGFLTVNKIRWDSVTGPYNLPANLRIPWNKGYIKFHFAGNSFYNPDQQRFTYLLDGIDENWSAITDDPFTETYRNLSPGSYTFKVSSKGFNGRWSKPAEMSFRILPPWWQTWWAYLVYGLALAFLIRLIVIYRIRRLKKENINLENKIALRTHELSDSLKELKGTQSQLIQKEKMASLGELTAGVAHEIQNPLNFVNNFSDINNELLLEIKEELRNKNYQETDKMIDDIIANEQKINHHGKRAEAIVKGMLEHSRTSTGQKALTDLNKLVDEYLRLSYHGFRAKDKSLNVTLHTDLDRQVGNINVVAGDIGRVLLNLYNNAFYAVSEKKKEELAAFEPCVSVSTKKINVRPEDPFSQGKVEIRVKDNANGIPQKIVDKIFQPFFTTKPTGQGTGLGLSLSYDIVKAHGGEIRVETKEGQGSEFTVELPIA